MKKNNKILIFTRINFARWCSMIGVAMVNIFLYALLGIIFYLFISDLCEGPSTSNAAGWDLKFSNTLQIFIFTIISFAVSTFISDNFKLSNIKFIKFLQKFVFINSIISLIGLIFYLFDISIFNTIFCDSDDEGDEITKASSTLVEKDVVIVKSNIDENNEEYYSFKIKKSLVDRTLEKGSEILKAGLNSFSPEVGIGVVAGKAVSEAFKHTTGMAPLPRIAAVGATVLATTAATKIGMEAVKAITGNPKIVINSDSSKSFENIDGRNSPTNFDRGLIYSVLEENEIPLITIVNAISYLNYIEFSLTLGLFSLLFRKFLNRRLKNFILTLINKFIKNKQVSINDNNVNLNKVFNTVDKYTEFIVVFVFICLFWVKFMNIYISSNLAENIDSYVNVYNYIKNNSFFYIGLISIKNKHIVYAQSGFSHASYKGRSGNGYRYVQQYRGRHQKKNKTRTVRSIASFRITQRKRLRMHEPLL